MKGHTITPMKAASLRKVNDGWGNKRHPQILTEQQIIDAATAAFSDVCGTSPTITAKDVCRAAGVKPNMSLSHDIRRTLLKHGYIEHPRTNCSYYTKPVEVNT